MSRSIQTAVDIDAGAQCVWSVLADLPAYASWNPYYRSAQGSLKAGQRVILEAALDNSGKTSRSRPLVTHVEEGHLATWRNRFLLPGLLTTTHTFALVPLGANRTRLEQTETFDGALVSSSTSIIDQVEVRLRQLEQAVKERCEHC